MEILRKILEVIITILKKMDEKHIETEETNRVVKDQQVKTQDALNTYMENKKHEKDKSSDDNFFGD